ncbi:MAG: metallophosphoesterase family protein [Candidatus Njordarchaeales archaeon]
MKILAFSDVIRWAGFKEIVNREKPNVVCLAGDLVSDGFAELNVRKEEHVKSFYEFLQYCSERSRVLVVKGNHDEDFEGDYSPGRINEISGCFEISGKTINLNNFLFLGLGFKEARRLRRGSRYLQSLIEKIAGKVDIIIMHGENIRYTSLLNPKIIIKGGLRAGKCIINNIPAVFTGPNVYAVIEIDDREILNVEHFTIGRIGLNGKKPMSVRDIEKISVGIPLPYKNKEWVAPFPSES